MNQQQLSKSLDYLSQQSQFQLIALLQISLVEPTQKLENQLKKYSIQSFIKIALNNKNNIKIRIGAAAATKMLVLQSKALYKQQQKLHHNKILHQTYIRLYQQRNQSKQQQRIFSIFQSILNTLYSITMSQQQKRVTIEQIITSIKKSESSIKEIPLNLKIMSILISTMTAQDLNNIDLITQICSIWLVVWNQRNQKSKQLWESGGGVQMCIASAECIKNIIDISQQNQQQDNLPQKYLINRYQMQKMMLQILSVDENGNPKNNFPYDTKNIMNLIQEKRQLNLDNGCLMILPNLQVSLVQKLSKLKTQILQLWNDTWIYRAQQPIFLSALKTILATYNKQQSIMDFNQEILIQSMKILQRSTNYQSYYNILYKYNQVLIVCLLNLIKAKNSEIEMISLNPQQFVDLQEDFCMKQDGEMLKTRAGSLLSILCLSIDSYLTITFNICMLSIQPNMGSQLQIQHLKQTWKLSPDQKAQVGLLVLACISDQIQKRKDLNQLVHEFLYAKQKQLQEKMNGQYLIEIRQNYNLILKLCRLITLYSFNSYPSCLNPFLPLFSIHTVFQYQLRCAFRTIVHYQFHKQDKKMRQYINVLVRCILLQTNQLNALLQNTIVGKFQLIAMIQAQVLEKLTVWFLTAYDTRDLQKCNKLTMLLMALIGKFKAFKGQQKITFQILANFLNPLYKTLINSNHHPAESCIIDIATIHAQKIGLLNQLIKQTDSNDLFKQNLSKNQSNSFRIQMELDSMNLITESTNKFSNNQIKDLNDLYYLGRKIVSRNNGMLNNCLQLFFCIVHNKNQISSQIIPDTITWMQKINNQQQNQKYVWELATLLQILILYSKNSEIPKQQQIFQFLLRSLEHYKDYHLPCRKLLYCAFALIMVSKNSRSYIQKLNGMIVPKKFTPPELKNYCLYLIKFAQLMQNCEYLVYIFKTLIELIQQYESPNLQSNFQQIIYVREFDQDQQIDCYHRTIKLYKTHPLKQSDIYEKFRILWQSKGQYLKTRFVGNEQLINYLKDFLVKKIVNKKSRKVYKVNRNLMNERMEANMQREQDSTLLKQQNKNEFNEQ